MPNDDITILFVDDEASVLHSLERYLIRERYHLLFAQSGPHALEIMTQQTVNIIVTDMKMPGMKGLELLKQVKKRYPDTVRLVLSGYSQISSIVQAINNGEIYRYITKPIEPVLFKQTLNDALDFYLMNQDRQDLIERLKQKNHELSQALKEKDAAQKKIELAQTQIEQTLLQGKPPEDINALDIAVLSRSAKNIGGDFYDMVKTRPNVLDIIIGDVMGKGILAALVGAGTKQSFLKSLSERNSETPMGTSATPPSPALLTQRVQQLITPGLFKLESFVTTLYARIDLEQSHLIFSDCGHTPIVLYRLSDDQCRTYKGHNTPLGVQKEESILETTIPVQDGDLLLLLSDGIIETCSSDGELFGIDRLCQFIKAHHHHTSRQILALLEEKLDHFRKYGDLQDDLTCICVRIDIPEHIKRK